MTAAMPIVHARGGPADELASPRAGCPSTSPRRSRWLAEPGLRRRQRQRRPGLRPEPDRRMSRSELSSPPSLTALYPRAVAVPLLRKVPGRRRRRRRCPTRELAVARRRGRPRAPRRLHARSAASSAMRPRCRPTYPHVLAFPLAMRLMTERAFPFPLLGLVHIGNEIDQLPPDRAPTRRSPCAYAPRTCARTTAGTQFDDRRRGARSATSSSGARAATYLRPRRRRAPAPATRERDDGPRRRASLARARRHRPPLRAPSRATATRSTCTAGSAKLFGMPAPDRPRHVAEGALPGRARGRRCRTRSPSTCASSCRCSCPRRSPSACGDGGAFEVRDASSGKPHLSGTISEGA